MFRTQNKITLNPVARASRPYVGCLLFLLINGSLNAQTLNLSSRPKPPDLGNLTYTQQVIGELEREIADLIAAQRAGDAIQQVTLRASVSYRIIAADLLSHGDKAGIDGSIAIITGHRLYRERREIDTAIESLITLEKLIEESEDESKIALNKRFDDALANLDHFNEAAVIHADEVRTADAAKLDRVLPMILGPLAQSISLLHDQVTVDHWIIAPGSVDSSNATSPDPKLRSRLANESLRNDTRIELLELLDLLERGQAFAEYRARIRAYRQFVAWVIEVNAALHHAKWLDDSVRQQFTDRLHNAVILFKDTRTRLRGEHLLDRLVISSDILKKIDALGLADEKHPLELVKSTFLKIESSVEHPGEADQGAAQLKKLRVVLNRMIIFRQREPPDLRGEVKSLHRRLIKSYETAERVLLAQIHRLADDPAVMSDPAFGSFIADQHQYLQDIERVESLPRWIDLMRAIHPAAVNGLNTQMRKLSGWLLDSNRRPDAVSAMDQFEKELALFYPLPFEQSLQQNNSVAAMVTGGLAHKLAKVIQQQRNAWADQWARGNRGGDESPRMYRLHRLAQALADTAELRELSHVTARLNRWAAWEMGRDSVGQAVAQMPARLKLAVHAAIAGDETGIERQLQRIDRYATLAQLVGRLAQRIGEPLENLPDGAIGVLGQCLHPPTENAWLVDQRQSLADLCRYALELDYALASGRTEAASKLSEYVNAQANELLKIIDER